MYREINKDQFMKRCKKLSKVPIQKTKAKDFDHQLLLYRWKSAIFIESNRVLLEFNNKFS